MVLSGRDLQTTPNMFEQLNKNVNKTQQTNLSQKKLNMI